MNLTLPNLTYPNLFRPFLVKKWGTTGLPFSFYIANQEKRKKIGFPMPAAENGFQILNLHVPQIT